MDDSQGLAERFQAGRTHLRAVAPLPVAALAATLLLAASQLLVYQHDGGWMFDAKVYRTAGDALLRGLDLYSPARGQHFTYTPFAALLFAPFSWLPMPVFSLLWTVLSIACLEVSVWLGWGWLGVPGERPRVLLTGAVCVLTLLAFEPVSLTVLLGQINLILMAAVLLDLRLPDRSRWKGLGIGLAAGIKLIPAFFIVYLVATRRLRAAAVATAALLGSIALGFVASPASSLEYWGGVFLDSGRVGDPQNIRSQSLQSLLVRWLHTTQGVRPAWFLVSLAIAGLALLLAVLAHRRGEELLAACVCALASAFLSPITWQHHWVWMVPMLLWLAARALRQRSPLLGAVVLIVTVEFMARPYAWGLPRDPAAQLQLGFWQLVLASTYALTAAGLLALAALLVRQRRVAAMP